MKNTNEESFQADVLDAESAVVVFIGPWADCSGVLEAVEAYESNEDIEVKVVDLADNLAAPIAVAVMVTALPCIISYEQGEEAFRIESAVVDWLSL